MGYAEAAVGLGQMLGPVIGSIIYTFCGFMGTFLIFALLNTIGAILVFRYIPSALNKVGEEDPDKTNLHD